MEQQLVNDVLKDYEEGMPFLDIKRKFKISNNTIYKILEEYGTPEMKEKHNMMVERKSNKHKKRLNISMEEVVKDIENGMRIKDVLKKYKISKTCLRNRRQEYEKKYGKINKKKRERPIRKKIKIILPMEEVVKDIQNRMPLQEVAKKYQISMSTLRERRQEYEEKYGKIQKVEKTEEHRIKRARRELPMEEVAEDIRKRMPLKDILEKYNVTKNIFDARRREYEAIHGKIKKRTVNIEKEKKEIIIKEKKQPIKKVKESKEPTQRPRQKQVTKKISIKKLWEEYIHGITLSELAERYKIETHMLKKNLNDYRNLLMTKAYLKGVSIGELTRNSNLPLETVKEGIQEVLKEYINKIPVEEYLKMYIRYKKEPLTKEQLYRKIILEYEKQKRQERARVVALNRRNIERDDYEN